jgi:queuine tRNA-ribosyltransferase
LKTSHGEVLTPSFVPVGTKATVKSVTPEQLEGALSQIVLANTYHLHLEPGEKVIKKAGGLCKFMNWQGPTMTDSGGFQAFSLGVAYGHGLGKFISADSPEQDVIEELGRNRKTPKKAKVTEKGVEFYSIIDGSKRFLSPEKSIQIQKDIGADIIFALDEFTSPHADFGAIKSTIDRTERWAKRCVDEMKKSHKSSISESPRASSPAMRGRPDISSTDFCSTSAQALFGIVQGGRYEDLRKTSARQISRLSFDGFGIGGTFVKEDMATAVRWVNDILPEEKPRHLLGVGEPIDLLLAVENGCDTFDCVAPTRMARNGGLYTRKGKINITNAKYKNLFEPIERTCGCYTCKSFSCAYLSHLFRGKEMLAATLSTVHNIYFLNSLMRDVRNSILDGNFQKFKEKFIKSYKA